MTNSQLKTVQENIFSIREVAMEMLQSSDNNMIELAHILSDRVTDIEIELYNPEQELIEQHLLEPEEILSSVYNYTSNRIETIHPTHISSVPCYTFTFEEWRQENYDAITEYIAEYPDHFTPDMTRYNMEMKLWIAGPGPTGIYNDDIIFRVELEEALCNPEPEVSNAKDALIYGSHTTFDELINDEDIDYSSWTIHDCTKFWQNKIISEGKK